MVMGCEPRGTFWGKEKIYNLIVLITWVFLFPLNFSELYILP